MTEKPKSKIIFKNKKKTPEVEASPMVSTMQESAFPKIKQHHAAKRPKTFHSTDKTGDKVANNFRKNLKTKVKLNFSKKKPVLKKDVPTKTKAAKVSPEDRAKIRNVHKELNKDIKNVVKDYVAKRKESENKEVDKPYHTHVIYRKDYKNGKTNLVMKHLEHKNIESHVSGRLKHPNGEKLTKAIHAHSETKKMKKNGYSVHKVYGSYVPNHHIAAQKLIDNQNEINSENKKKEKTKSIKESVKNYLLKRIEENRNVI